VQALGLLQAGSGTYDPATHTLTLNDVGEHPIWYADRPNRDMGTEPLRNLLDAFFSHGRSNNAAVSTAGTTSRTTIAASSIFTLSSPTLSASGTALTFHAVGLSDAARRWVPYTSAPQLPKRLFRNVSVFLDSANEPNVTVRTSPLIEETAFIEAAHAKLDASSHILTLNGPVTPAAVFTNQPRRILGREKLAELISTFFERQGSVPPNAAITVATSGGPRSEVFTLSQPNYSVATHTLTMRAIPATRFSSRWSKFGHSATIPSGTTLGSVALMIDNVVYNQMQTGMTGANNSPQYFYSSGNPNQQAWTEEVLYNPNSGSWESDRTCGIDIDMSGLSGGSGEGVSVVLNPPVDGITVAFDDSIEQNSIMSNGQGSPWTQAVAVPYGWNLNDNSDSPQLGWANVASDGFATGCTGNVTIQDANLGTPIATLNFENPYVGSDSTSCTPQMANITCSASGGSGDNALFSYAISGVVTPTWTCTSYSNGSSCGYQSGSG
jgi:uncharacterized protein YbdZ (MbtH family)